VASLPPCRLNAEVKAVTGLSASLPSRHSPPAWSMNCLSCAAGAPNRLGVPNANASAHAKSSTEA
jgi:hypothetical protein